MVQRLWSILLIIGLSIVSTPGAAVTQSRFEGSASITGRVTDAEGKPLPDTKVTAYNSLLDFEREAKASAFDGTFAIDRLPFGEYEVVAFAEGYDPVVYFLEVGAGETVSIEAKLLPATPLFCFA